MASSRRHPGGSLTLPPPRAGRPGPARPTSSPAARLVGGLGLLLAAALTAVLACWPALRQVERGQGTDGWTVLGQGIDLDGTLWTYAHVDAMLTGRAGLRRPDVFAPIGFDLAQAQGMAWLDAVMAWPLVRLLGVPGFYSPWVLLLLALDHLALAALLRRLRAPWLVAVGLSAAVVLSPFVTRELFEGRPTQVHLVFHVAFLAAVVALGDGARRPLRVGLLGGLSLAAACLVYWFGAMGVGLLGAVAWAVGLAQAQGRGPAPAAASLRGGAVLALAAVATAMAAAWPVLAELSAHTSAMPLTDPDGLAPAAAAVERAGLPLSLALGAALLLALARSRASLPWLVGTLLLGALPLGPWIHLGEVELPGPLLALEHLMPWFRRLQAPERLAVVPLLGLACAAATAAGALATTPARTRLLGALALVVAAGAWTEVRARSPKWQPRASVELLVQAPFYRDLADRWPGGIIDLPLERSNESYVYQLVHGLPVMGGPGINGPHTRPEAHRAWVEANSFLVALEAVARGEEAPEVRPEDRRAVYAAGFRTVVVHLDEDDEGLLGRLAPLLGPPMLSADDRVAMPLVAAGRPGVRPGRTRGER
ncbi:hypothetical protein L6R53_30660 [Myxococcota bacterium]|nr:hypothetical protein [Myxococcota bacterium]